MISAGHHARTSYNCDIKTLKLQIYTTGYNSIQNNCKFAIYRPYLIGYNANSIMRHNYKQFIPVNDRITLTDGVYRLILMSSLNTLCATADMRAAVVLRIGGKWEVREVPTPEPSANQVSIKIHASRLCYSDVHNSEGRVPIPIEFSFILGHEPAGEIVAVGEEDSTTTFQLKSCMRFLKTSILSLGLRTQNVVDILGMQG